MAGAVVVVALAGLVFRGRSPARAAGQTYVPASDDVIVERLGSRSGRDPRSLAIASLRQALAESPRDPRLASQLARLEIEESRRRSDPRHLGYAQAALQPWWHEPAPPVDVLILRATILQSRHAFEPALVDLEQAVARAPDSAQAWLTRSVVSAVLARYDEARASCDPLARLATALVVAACRAPVDGVTGRAAVAARQLGVALAAAPLDDGDRPWALSVLADLDVARGDNLSAERHLRDGLTVNPDDAYSRAALADLLIESGREADAILVVSGREQNDTLLLRLAIAEHALRAPAAEAHAAALSERFAASRARGDALHGREEARFELTIRNNPARALELAEANWQVQHEPADACILLQTAVATSRPDAAKPALEWLRRTGDEDQRLAALARSLR